MAVINLDAMQGEFVTVILDTQEYVSEVIDLEMYGKIIAQTERIQRGKGGKNDEVLQMEQARYILSLCFPTIGAERLGRLSMRQFGAIFGAISQQLEESGNAGDKDDTEQD